MEAQLNYRAWREATTWESLKQIGG